MNTKNRELDGSDKSFRCGRCHKGFDTRQKLGTHKFVKHGTRSRKNRALARITAKVRGTPDVAKVRVRHSMHFCPGCGLNLDVLGKAMGSGR